jgi:pimeloyl-ACP methyl ester carboxylesterase
MGHDGGVMIDYDEFGLFHENAAEYGIAYDGPPVVRRTAVEVAPGRSVSALQWGRGEPEVVLVHGGAQNAHTWDTVALAIDRPLLAVDLPGHGHSDWRHDGFHGPRESAPDIAAAIRALAPEARMVVGMSLGGLTSIALCTEAPELVRRLVLVDVTPGVDGTKASAIAAFVDGPEYFESFDALLARTVEHNPTRSVASLRRGVLHNAKQLPDGRWVWRYARTRRDGDIGSFRFSELWDDLERVTVPTLLVRGALSPVVDDADVAELHRRRPDANVEVVDGAGHSVQGDRPVELARLLADFLDASP